MNKKNSLTLKLFYMNGGLILFVIFLSFLLNNLYLSKYHISKKKKELTDIAKTLQNSSVNDGFDIIINEISQEHNISIMPYQEFIGVSAERINRGPMRMHSMMMADNTLSDNELNSVKSGKIITKLFKNSMMNVNNLTAFVQLKDSNIAVLINSGLIINESTAIAKEFYIIIAPITLFISLIASYLFTRRITKPLQKLKLIANKMADMDFSEKFDLNTNDEIEELGKTFNYLSNQLEMNISNLNSVAEKLKKEISLEKELDKKKTEFISNVSHELKTPISLISAYAEGLQDGIPTEEDKNYYYSIIINESEKMNKLVQELTEFMKIKDKRSEIIYEIFEPIKIIEKVVNKFKLDYLEKNIDIQLIFPENEIIKIKSSKLKFEQIIDNLLSNALNHVNRNGIIKIELSIRKTKLNIGVFNSGSVIPEESKNNVWEPFYKLDKARKRKYGGIGLGLSIVKEIFDIYNFDYGISNIKDGVEFYFSVDINN